MERMDKIYNMVLQSSTKGIRAVEIADRLKIHKTMVYRDLNSLNLMGKVESDQGIWRAKTGEQTIKPLEKEIVIELPTPKNQWHNIARLDVHAKYMDNIGLHEIAKWDRTFIEKFNETRTIRIKGKNVDDLDLEKLGNLIQQATKKSSKFSWGRISKGLKNSSREHL
jgi:sugar-specific transcriptional regulator TrmB